MNFDINKKSEEIKPYENVSDYLIESRQSRLINELENDLILEHKTYENVKEHINSINDKDLNDLFHGLLNNKKETINNRYYYINH